MRKAMAASYTKKSVQLKPHKAPKITLCGGQYQAGQSPSAPSRLAKMPIRITAMPRNPAPTIHATGVE